MRQGQAFTIDLIMAVIILIVGSVVMYQSFSVEPVSTQARSDAVRIASAIFEPYPHDWNSTSVVSPGFVNDHRLDFDLMMQFSSLSYDELTVLLGVNSDFWVLVGESGGPLMFAGNMPGADAQNVHSVQRYAAHNGEIVPIQVGAWR